MALLAAETTPDPLPQGTWASGVPTCLADVRWCVGHTSMAVNKCTLKGETAGDLAGMRPWAVTWPWASVPVPSWEREADDDAVLSRWP